MGDLFAHASRSDMREKHEMSKDAPGAPIAFAGVDSWELHDRVLPEHVTGVLLCSSKPDWSSRSEDRVQEEANPLAVLREPVPDADALEPEPQELEAAF